MRTLKIKDKSKLFFVSDLHWYHERIIKLAQRKMSRPITEPTAAGARGSIESGDRLFKDAHEMNEEMIRLWNEHVPKDAIIIDLGDTFFKAKREDVKPLLKRLNFKEMHVIRGNHGRNYYKEFQNIGRKVVDYEDSDIVHIIVEDEEFDDGICEFMACHYPIVEWNRKFKGALHLYGHTHRDHPGEMPGSLHVGVDTWGLKPASYFEILIRIYLKSAKKEIDDN